MIANLPKPHRCIKSQIIWSWYQIWHEGLAVTFTTDHGIFRALCFSSYHCFVDNMAQAGRADCKMWKQQRINKLGYCAKYIWKSERPLRPWVTFLTQGISSFIWYSMADGRAPHASLIANRVQMCALFNKRLSFGSRIFFFKKVTFVDLKMCLLLT